MDNKLKKVNNHIRAGINKRHHNETNLHAEDLQLFEEF